MTAELIRQVAADLQAALNRELQAKTSLSIASQRKEQLQTQLAELEPKIERFSNAKSALETIRHEHSLTQAMDESLNAIALGSKESFLAFTAQQSLPALAVS